MPTPAPDFCSSCGERLVCREIEDRTRNYCPDCEKPRYRNPKPCAGVLVLDGSRLLLVERTRSPGEGTWSLPAGYLEHDEPAAAAAVRELAEETAVVADPTVVDLFGTRFIEHPDGTTVVVLVYTESRADTTGVPSAGSDAAAARFWSLGELEATGERIESGYERLFRRAIREQGDRTE